MEAATTQIVIFYFTDLLMTYDAFPAVKLLAAKFVILTTMNWLIPE